MILQPLYLTTGGNVMLQNKTVNPSTSSQTIGADTGYDGLGTVTVNAMASGTAGTPTATKGSVSNNAISVTPSVTNTTGYITGGTKTGTAVSVAASELVSGTLSITTNGTQAVTNYANVNVNISIHTRSASTSLSSYTASLNCSGQPYTFSGICANTQTLSTNKIYAFNGSYNGSSYVGHLIYYNGSQMASYSIPSSYITWSSGALRINLSGTNYTFSGNYLVEMDYLS